MTEQDKAEGRAPVLDIELYGWNFPQFSRMEIRKTLRAYLRDMLSWLARGKKFREEWLRDGGLPPDWYRDETDAEFRARMQAALNGGKNGQEA